MAKVLLVSRSFAPKTADDGISALGEKLTPSNERSMSAFPQQRTFRNATVTSALCQIAHIG
jgi:hypothetical protein